MLCHAGGVCVVVVVWLGWAACVHTHTHTPTYLPYLSHIRGL